MKYQNICDRLEYDSEACKQCKLCVEFCPVNNLTLEQGKIKSAGKCTTCGMCEKFCPDMAIRVIK